MLHSRGTCVVTDFLNLRGSVVVVTGAASGMGRAVAQAAAREGARLVLSDVDAAVLEELVTRSVVDIKELSKPR